MEWSATTPFYTGPQLALQPRPSTKGWNVWLQGLRALIGANEEGRLPVHFLPMNPRSNWIWFFSPSENRVFEMRQHAFRLWSISRGDTRKSKRHNLRFRFSSTDIPKSELPADIIPVTGYHLQEDWVLDGMGVSQQAHEIMPTESKWLDSVITETLGDTQLLKEQFILGNIVIMCDGSIKNGYGAGAWRITTFNTINSELIQGSARTAGNIVSLTSHRAECTGILGGLHTFNDIYGKWDSIARAVTILCDNLSAVRHCMNILQHSNLSKLPDYYILHSIKASLKSNINMIGAT
jgi:hypothetical protein